MKEGVDMAYAGMTKKAMEQENKLKKFVEEEKKKEWEKVNEAKAEREKNIAAKQAEREKNLARVTTKVSKMELDYFVHKSEVPNLGKLEEDHMILKLAKDGKVPDYQILKLEGVKYYDEKTPESKKMPIF